MKPKPNPFELYCMYYLGLTPDWDVRFHNIHAVARHYGVSADQVGAWLNQHHMGPEVMQHLDFNVARQHGEAQGIALGGSREDLKDFARQSFDEFRGKISSYDPSREFPDIDYDDIWGDG